MLPLRLMFDAFLSFSSTNLISFIKRIRNVMNLRDTICYSFVPC